MQSRVLFLVVVFAACSDDKTAQVASSAPAPRAPVVTPKPVDLRLGEGLEMRHPIRDGRLSVIPIVATAPPANAAEYLTLADGQARHLVTIREIGRNDEFQVDHVRIRNKSRQPLFVMSGEMIVDGLQDRVIAEDRVIEPGKSVKVEVRCVEMGREIGHLMFRPNGVLAELELRQTVIERSQTEVWQLVDTINTRHHLSPSTKTYRGVAELQNSGDQAARRGRVMAQLDALPDHDRLVGLATVLDGQVMSIERFATPALFGALEAELVGSYIASDGGAPHEGRTFLPKDVRALAISGASHTTDASVVTLQRL